MTYKPFCYCNGLWPASYRYGPADKNLTGGNANCDWGVFNAILNGGDEPGRWRTLSRDEWAYLMNGRTNATSLRGVGSVNGVRGLILLPDGWNGLDISTTSIGTHTVTDDNSDKPAAITWADNMIDAATWATMEAAGAVFLPAAGTMSDASPWAVGYYNLSDTSAGISYWTTTYRTDRRFAHAFDLGTAGSDINWRFDQSSRSYGRAVRLVKDAN